jgi:hypothetical protein
MHRMALSVLVAALGTAPSGDGPPLRWDELKSLSPDCPIVYDNDWLRDTVDDEYLFAKVQLGKARLVGLILSKDMWDHGKQYKVEDGLRDFEANLAIVREQGWRHIPGPTIGASRLLERPTSGRVDNTKPVEAPGVELIVREARKATSERPLVVIVGGPLITVASAYLTDPSIADRMVVHMTDISGYNGSDPWANYIVATRCKLANFGASPLWWPQPPAQSVIPPDRFHQIPSGPLADEMKRVADSFYERSHRRDHPDRCDGLADGAGTLMLFRPELWKAVRFMRVEDAWHPTPVPGGPYHYLDAQQVDFDGMRDEFFSTIAAALSKPTPR